MYPNPTNGAFQFDLELGSAQPIQVKVLSATGQTVWSRTWDSAREIRRETVDLSACASGIYVVQVTTEDGVATRRISVQK
jgi:hypothetical protein